jgi:peptide/nickel transport system substrate-binding protein
MRKTLAVGLAMMLLVAACSTADSGDDAPPPSTLTTTSSTTAPASSTSTTTTLREPSGPGYGGVAVVADDQYPTTLNPFAPGGDNFITTIIGQAWMTGAWDIDAETLDRVPEVVVDLPTVSNGGVAVDEDGTMTVTYVLRDEAVWSDGVPISGEDLAFTVEAALSVEEDAEFETPYTDVGIIGMEPGDKTFTMTLRNPTIAYETLFQWILPHHAIEETTFPDDWVDELWPSGGPFIIDTIDPDTSITAVRNDRYWKVDPDTGLALPYLDSVEFRFIPETEEVIRAFQAREVDVIQPSPSLEFSIRPIMSLEADGAALEVRSGPVWEHVNFQFGPGRLERSPDSCNENLALRRAVMHAIDRDAAVEDIYGGFVEAATSWLDAYTPSLSSGAWDRYPHDPARAAELYTQAVAETGTECAVVFSTTSNADMRPRLADLYVDMLTEAGIPITLDLLDSQLFFGEVLDDGLWDVGQWAWVGAPGLSGVVAAHSLFDPSAPPPDGMNYYRWGTRDSSVRDEHTVRYAEIVERMNATVDDTEIRELIAEAEEILADQAVILPMFSRASIGAVWGDEIGGYRYNPSFASHTWNIEYWYRTDR